MKLTVTFNFDSVKIPIAYRHIIQGIIYNALSDNPKYSAFVHDGGYESESRKYKLFTFGPLTGNYAVNGNTISFTDSASLEVRSCNPEFIQALLVYFSSSDSVFFGDKKIAVNSCRLDDKKIFESEITVKSVSPVVSYITRSDLHTVYFTPEENEFYTQIITNAKRKYHAACLDSEASLEIAPASDTFRKNVTKFKSTYITGYTGRFILKGNPELLTFLYNTGLGAKNSQGFGMFEVIK